VTSASVSQKAVTFGEALLPQFNTYSQQVLNNAQTLDEGPIKERFRLVSGGTDNHLVLVDLRSMMQQSIQIKI
jgi:glycine hydroxymethyltransferase